MKKNYLYKFTKLHIVQKYEISINISFKIFIIILINLLFNIIKIISSL